MDIVLLKTFIEVAGSGSFVAASERLYVTQSAVSLRIQRLEDSLGHPLFLRSKAGVELTPAGRKFEHYALGIISLWEEALRQIAIPEGFHRSLTIGAQYSLWPGLGFRWLDRIQTVAPDLNLRAELGMPDRLTRFLTDGTIQCALTYTPKLRPGLDAQKIIPENLVMVASWANPTAETVAERYVLIDWGQEFIREHSRRLPQLKNTALTLSVGALGAEYLTKRNAAAYLPARYVQRYLDAGLLHLVPDAPRFPYPIWVVWRTDVDPIIRAAAESTLREVTSDHDTTG